MRERVWMSVLPVCMQRERRLTYSQAIKQKTKKIKQEWESLVVPAPAHTTDKRNPAPAVVIFEMRVMQMTQERLKDKGST